MKNDYFEKREARLERFKALAESNEKLSFSLWKKSDEMASAIPFGQPILIGHHSEKRDRNYRNKIHNTMGKSVEAGRKADYYAEKVAAAESNSAISSDHPDAIRLLEEKLENMQKAQELYKAINKIVKKAKLPDVERVADLMALGMAETTAVQLITPDPRFFNRVGIPGYKLTNNNGNMKRVRDRIAHLKSLEAMDEIDIQVGAIRILSSPATNRTQIFFPGKPAEEIRKDLRASGFRWAPTEMAWQRNLSNWAHREAVRIVEKCG